jgi:cell cycle arrest protein BUB3
MQDALKSWMPSRGSTACIYNAEIELSVGPVMSEIHLSTPPSDGVSNVVFGRHTPDSLLVSSWDNSVRLYNTTQNVQLHQYQHKAAVLDVCFGRSDGQCFSGSVDRSVRLCDFSTGLDSHIGSHDNAVKSVAYLRGAGVLVTGRLGSVILIVQ